MQYLLTLAFPLNTLSTSNSIFAIVSNNIITYNSIVDQINKNTNATKEQKLALVNQKINIVLQKKYKSWRPRVSDQNLQRVDIILVNIAKQNALTLKQLQSNRQYQL